MPHLFVLTGADAGRSFKIGHGATLGRSSECTVCLRDSSVSRQHARVECTRDGGWFVVDNGSRNGISVGKERAPRIDLADQAEFQVGEVLLRFRSDDARSLEADLRGGGTAEEEIVLEGGSGVELQRTVIGGSLFSRSGRPAGPLAGPLTGGSAGMPAGTANQPSLARTDAVPRPMVEVQSGAEVRRAADVRRAARSGNPAGPVSLRGDRGLALQFQRAEDRRGLLNADLGQMPAWQRWALVVLALLAAAGICYAAFRGTAFLRGEVSGLESTGE